MRSLMFPYGALDLLHDHIHRHHNHDHEHDKRDKLRAVLISSGGGDGGMNIIEEENEDRDRDAGQILVIENAGSGGSERGYAKEGRADREREKNANVHEETGGRSAASCKYIRFERRVYPKKFIKEIRVPNNSNVSTISAIYEIGVLTVNAEKKLPPPPAKLTIKTA
ncbi:hypothetical protein MKW92_008562 [Papaver armeniacum]|nr:hypothetical protein MKW92_008562 [Papaver armeniacum]